MNVAFFWISLALYFISTSLAIIYIFRREGIFFKGLLAFTSLGFLSHTLSILLRFYESSHIPITNFYEASSFFSWCIVLLFFFLEYKYRIGLLGSFILPFVLILLLSSSTLPAEIKPLNPLLQSYWLGIHTVFVFLGNAAFALAFGIGIMYLIQEKYVKSKHLGGLFERLPSLQILDEVNYRLITIGFPFLTLAIISGALWAEKAWGSYWRWDPKEVWALITWFIYALVLHVRLVSGWRGKRAALLSIIGFASVLFTFLGVRFLIKGIHIFE
jgi:cytochrome c-type biogenesis protein CcsB